VTVAAAVKVFDGIVLATDSATTLPLDGGSAQVYNNANKIFHLHRDRPVAAMTWGLGAIGDASIATLAKDLRLRLMGKDPDFDWELHDDYTIEGVTERLLELMYDELYAPLLSAAPEAPVLGFMVAGYSGKAKQAEGWVVVLDSCTVRPVPTQEIAPNQVGWAVWAQAEATQRLFNGWDPTLPDKLATVVDGSEMPQVMQVLNDERRTAVPAAMPFADAIKFAQFLVDTTTGYAHFLLGPDTVGGPTELAGMSRHEGFKWIERKHYYRPDLNPKDPHP
jgi:hypothetical protein